GMNQNHLGLIVAIASALVFGLYPPTLRAVYADGGSAFLMIVVTTWMRMLGLVLYCRATGAPLFQTRENVKHAFIGSLFQTASIFGILLALLYMPGPLVLIIMFSHTMMLLLFMAWRGDVKLDAVSVIATAAAFLGLTLVLDIWHPQKTTYWIGAALAFMAALATMGRAYLYGKLTQNRKPITVGAEVFIFVSLFTLPALFIQTPHLPASTAGYIYALVSCLSLTLGTFGIFYGISLIGPFRWSLFLKLEPIFTALFSIMIFGKFLKLSQYIGMAVVLISLAGYQIVMQKRQA
ncbi:MAG: DMT family transporter, partial [Alphaproteobacteria bacterium]|nr:DMT family transporter [Alphaproteobacteria bacterium]